MHAATKVGAVSRRYLHHTEVIRYSRFQISNEIGNYPCFDLLLARPLHRQILSVGFARRDIGARTVDTAFNVEIQTLIEYCRAGCRDI